MVFLRVFIVLGTHSTHEVRFLEHHDKDFISFYGSHPGVYVVLWETMQSTELADARITDPTPQLFDAMPADNEFLHGVQMVTTFDFTRIWMDFTFAHLPS